MVNDLDNGYRFLPRCAMETKRTDVKNTDMSNSMILEAIEVAQEAMRTHTIEKDIAAFIKKRFDDKYKPYWHCVVGKSFGSFVTHETSTFAYFYYENKAILLFKCGC